MSFLQHCNLILGEHNLPSFLVDIYTDKILYANKKMSEQLGLEISVLGSAFYDVIHNDTSDFPFPPHGAKTFAQRYSESSGETYTKFFEYNAEFFCPRFGKKVYARIFPITIQNADYNVCQIEILGERGAISFEEAMTRCVTIKQQKQEDSIPQFLELLGQYYQGRKAYLYHIQNEKMNLIHSWKQDENISIVAEVSQKMNVHEVLEWVETRNEVGVIEANNRLTIEQSPTAIRILESYNIENLLLSAIEDKNGNLIALVGLSDRKENGPDLCFLHAITDFIKQKVENKVINMTVSQMAQKDLLTGFFARSSYSQTLDRLQKNPPKSLGVLFANVNGLKQVNTEYGYAKGDSYIKKASEVLKNHFDVEFYRISGDEFVAFYPQVEKKEFEEMVQAFYKSTKEKGDTSLALGYGWSSGRFLLEQLVEEADTVMYINKQEYYHSAKRSFEDINDRTLQDLLSYLDNDEFMVYLQPQINLSDNSLYGAEALIRRFDKTNQKMVFPDQFIPLYEKKSVIRHIDIFVVEKVCQLLQSWKKEWCHFPISVNLSRVTLLEHGIVETISKICDKYNVPHEMLVIEVTERVGLIENDVESSLITDFNQHGFKISLDDFGCAYSNIVTLAQINVDEVKIDKSLVDYLVSNEKNRILVKNILAMCNELKGTSTLAEGIEDQEQADLLREYHCHYGQGYLYSRPIPVDEFVEKYLKNISDLQ